MNNFRSKEAATTFLRNSIRENVKSATFSVRQNPKNAAERMGASYDTLFVQQVEGQITWNEIKDYIESLDVRLHGQAVSVFITMAA